MKIEHPESIQDIRRNIMVAYQATDNDLIKSALRSALRALSKAITPPDPITVKPTLAELRGKLETFR